MSPDSAPLPDAALILRPRAGGGWEFGDRSGFRYWSPWYERALRMAEAGAAATGRALLIVDIHGATIATIPPPGPPAETARPAR